MKALAYEGAHDAKSGTVSVPDITWHLALDLLGDVRARHMLLWKEGERSTLPGLDDGFFPAVFVKGTAMPQGQWSEKRKRQYGHIKEGLERRGKSEKTAEEIAARTVNKERAQHGEASSAKKSTLEDMPASKRGGLRSHTGEGGRTLRQLQDEARDKGVRGRSRMNKAELEAALRR